MKRYSLADYILSIKPNDPQINSDFGTITIGGEGSYTDSITLSPRDNLFETTGYNTGAWVHNKNLSRVGTAVISISQLSDQVKKFIMMAETYYTGDYDGFTLTVSTNEGSQVATCIDCYIQKIPDQVFGANSANQTWTFTCGKISFN